MSASLLEVVLYLVILVLIYVGYTQYLKSQRDIHPLALQSQSNIAPSRKEGESAVYRSALTPHEMPLVTGLEIRQGFKLRNGNVRDIWSIVMHKKQSHFTFVEEGVTLDYALLNAMMKQFNRWIVHNDVKVVGCCAPSTSLMAFVAALTCFTNDVTFHLFEMMPRSVPEVDVLLVSSDQLNHATKIPLKHFIVASDDVEESESVSSWNSIVNNTQTGDTIFEYKYQPSYDQGTPMIYTTSSTYSFTHQNFTSATGSLVKTLPLDQELNSNDSILVSTLDPSSWSKVFAVLLFGGSIILNPTTSSNMIDLCTKYNPTIISINHTQAKDLHDNITSGLSTFQSLKLARAQSLLSDGIFTKTAQLAAFKALRLIYVTSTGLPTSTLTSLRCLTGSRLIVQLTNSQLTSPLCSTNFYDYRILSTKHQLYGVASLSLEMKLSALPGLDIDNKQGELCVRGFVIGRPMNVDVEKIRNDGERVGGEGWMPTGIKGCFGRDGCFYEIK